MKDLKNNITLELKNLRRCKSHGIMPLAVLVIITFLILTQGTRASQYQSLYFGTYLSSQLEINRAEWKLPGVDLDKLAYAVSCAETSCGTKGTAITYNNMFGIMTWTSGGRKPKYYKTKVNSTKDFKRIWAKYYKTFPNLRMAKKWTGSDNAHNWLRIVNYYYYN